jgi:hypothetical protein
LGGTVSPVAGKEDQQVRAPAIVPCIAIVAIVLAPSQSLAGFLRDFERSVRHGARNLERSVRHQARGHERAWRHQLRDWERETRRWRANLGEPVLAEWIRDSRRQARRGCRPIPDDIYDRVRDFFDRRLLDSVCYSLRRSGELSLGRLATQYAQKGAITLDYVIVFQNEDLTFDDVLWAHELQHVAQYRRWGVNKFAEYYLRHWNKIENEAEKVERRYEARYSRHILYDHRNKEYCDPHFDEIECRDWR